MPDGGGLVEVDGPGRLVLVSLRDSDTAGPEDACAEPSLDGLNILVVQIEGGLDGLNCRDQLLLLPAEPTGIVEELVERGMLAAGDGIQLVEGFKYSSLAAFILADKARHTVLDGDRAGVLDGLVLTDMDFAEDHRRRGLRGLAKANAVWLPRSGLARCDDLAI